jgi:DNA-3-methyladenine glycosylase I
MMASSPTLAELARTYETTRHRAPRSIAELPTSTPEAEAFAKRLKSQGYRFVGPTSVYAFMQNTGVVNDHIHGCFRAARIPDELPTLKRCAWTTWQRTPNSVCDVRLAGA